MNLAMPECSEDLDYHHDNFISRLDQLAVYYERYSTFLKHARWSSATVTRRRKFR